MDEYRTDRKPVNFASLVAEMMPQLPGANPPYIRRVLHDRLQELCEETWCWEEHTPSISIKAGEQRYPIPMRYDARVLFIHAVVLAGRVLKPRDFQPLIDDADAPCVVLHRAPVRDEKHALQFHIALSPLAPCENFPDGFLEKHRRTLVAGTLATLMMEEAKPYANRTGAELNRHTWDKGVYECNARRRVGDTTQQLSALTTSWLPEF